MESISTHACFGGEQRFYRHDSRVVGLPMKFGVYLPPASAGGTRPVPWLLYLAGLTCTEETFFMKAGAQRLASQLGIALVAPDTSPRGANIEGEAQSWDFGVGAGFYLDATQEPWSRHWRMESYLLEELMPLVAGALALDRSHVGVFGHSMGGHGALVLAMRHPDVFRSVSAFAPVAAPMQAPWGVKAFTGYLGDDRAQWALHDASALMAAQERPPYPQGILVDQGLGDKFLADQLMPERFEEACAKVAQPLRLRRHPGYDHSYYFIATFVADHLRHHARAIA
jgi:S-formylglutathione hydrolase